MLTRLALVLACGLVAAAATWALRAHGAGPAASAEPGPRLGPLFTPEGGPLDVGLPPAGLERVTPDECAQCHREIVAEWQGSAHATAFTDPVFQAEYQRAPQAFCRHCHAPLLADGARAPGSRARSVYDQERTRRGIDCAVCHVRDGHILGPTGRGTEAHPVRRDPRLGTSAFCGACHQFDFPGDVRDPEVRYLPGEPLQDTLVEWRASDAARAGQACQDCHMPRVTDPGGNAHRFHGFPGLGDRDLMSQAVRVEVQAVRTGQRIQVEATIAGHRIGHMFPTGDMFRQARFTVTAGGVTQTAIMQRHFASVLAPDGERHVRRQVHDNRVPAPGAGPPRQLQFVLDEPTDARELSWTLELFRLPPKDARERGLPMDTVRIPVAAGRVPVRAARQ